MKHVTRKLHRNGLCDEREIDWRVSLRLVLDVRISLKHHRSFGKIRNSMNHVLRAGVWIRMEFNVEKFD